MPISPIPQGVYPSVTALDPKALRAKGITLVLVTLGGDGAFYRLGDQTGRVPGVETTSADTNGAGDTFLGAVLSRLCLRGEKPLAGLTAAEVESVLTFANMVQSKEFFYARRSL